jgi:D-alanine transaminase
VFAVFGDAVVTPPSGPTILSGVTREMVLDLARKEGLKVEERAISGPDLLQADEVFLTGTTMEVLSVSRWTRLRSGRESPPTALRLHFRLLEMMHP